MGTAAAEGMTRPVIESALSALADLPVQVFLTLPRAADQPWAPSPSGGPQTYAAPGNTVIQPYVRHAAVMPHTSVLVTHAGLGSIGAALTHGVPMVCIPLFLEQPDNASHVAALGAGRIVAKDAGSDAIRAAVLDVLSTPSYRQTAQHIAESLRTRGSGSLAVLELESLLSR
jgi:UDP:flavonoid glycosyltransferase YjiC (YdhE family)